MTIKPKINFLKRNFEEIGIMAVLAKMASDNMFKPSIEDEMVIQAFRRYKTDFESASLEEMGQYLNSMSDDSIAGVVGNVKGILHATQLVQIKCTTPAVHLPPRDMNIADDLADGDLPSSTGYVGYLK